MKLSRFFKLFSNFVKSIIGLARSGGSYSVEIASLQNAELLKNKGVLITGGTSGIGLRDCKAYYRMRRQGCNNWSRK